MEQKHDDPGVTDGEAAEPNPEVGVRTKATTAEMGGRRKTRRAIVLAALISGRTDAQAAAEARCSVSSVRRHRRDEAFKRELEEGREELVSAQTGRLLQTADRARETLERCLESESESIRLRAADLLLKAAERFHRTHETEANLAETTVKYEGVPENVKRILDIVGDDDGGMP
jgi:hypothetical protein